MPLQEPIPNTTHTDELSMTTKPYLTTNVIPSHHIQQQPTGLSFNDNGKRYTRKNDDGNRNNDIDDDEDEDDALHKFHQRIKRGRCKSPRIHNSDKRRSWISSDEDDDDDDGYKLQSIDDSSQQHQARHSGLMEKRKRGRPKKGDSGKSSPIRQRSTSISDTYHGDGSNNDNGKPIRKLKSKQKSQVSISTSTPAPSSSTLSTPTTPTTPTTKKASSQQQNSISVESPSSSKPRPSSLTDPNRTDKAGRTKLFAYTGSGHFDKVKELVSQGANVNFKDHAGWVPLHEAALKGQCEIAKFFIESGADVNVRGYGDDTPLHDACSSGYADITQLLVDNGADVYALNSDKQQPIDVCDNIECERIIEAKMKQLDRLVARDATGRTTLHRACADGLYNDVASLVKQGANVNSEDNKGWTPLHEAARHGHLSIVQLLVQHGADINHSGYQGTTVLHHACRSGHDDIVHFLVEHGADIQAQNENGKTPYQVTTSTSIRRDLAAKIDEERKQRATSDAIDEITFTTLRQRKLSNKSSSRNTPLSREERKIQAIMKSFEALEQQQPKQSPSSRPSRSSRRRDVTPTSGTRNDGMDEDEEDDDDGDDDESNKHVDQVKSGNNKQEDDNDDATTITPVRRKRGGSQHKRQSSKSSRTTRSPSREQSVDNTDSSQKTTRTTKKVDATKLDPHKKDTSGRTHLHRWAIRGDVEVVQILLQAGADPNVTDHAGYTPLHESSLRGRGNVVKLLLENGANVDAKGVELDTALHDAIDNEHPDVVEILLQFGADPHIRNSKGMSPMEIAKEHDLFDIQHLLQQAITNWKKKKTIKQESTLQETTQQEQKLIEPPKRQARKRRLVLAADLEHSSSTPVRRQSPSPELLDIKTEPSTRIGNPMDIHMLTGEKPPLQHSSTASSSHTIKSRKKDPIIPPTSPTMDGPHTPIPTPFVEHWLGKKVKEEHNNDHDMMSNCDVEKYDDKSFIKTKVATTTTTATTTIQEIGATTMTNPPPQQQRRSRTLSEALRYLPLYTVQLVEEDGKQSSLYVLDLQVGLLLNLSTDALWKQYPNLRRRQVTFTEKERLWSPLAGMLCTVAASPSLDNLYACDKKRAASVVARLRDQEKQRFMDLPVSFVQLDQVVSLIKHDYGYLSENLITITVDIGYQQDASPSQQYQTTTLPAIIHDNNKDLSKTPLKKRPAFGLPPKFAMKMQKHVFYNNNNGGDSSNSSLSNPSSPHS
ncbi:ankyrin repeat-containing domain protein [Halteromyces radiatus]|uniref:ankyrin repeat-containing domain protein n=1 Tax=Halteromyces radiatus TaxID=101107 RepID=UPI00221E7673|nr:ankyrin repeat-containing domain protein [Halteromyces radiatus]KAI8086071.1 ankyrin repeat-containing domain protein [Halteromyces radiatus]